MTLFRAFLAHEWLTQVRAARFRLAAVAYVALAAAPAVVVKIVAARAEYVVGPASYAAALMLFQPLFTTLFAGAVAIDAITREREESSFAVVSLAPLSAAGYVLHRWLAIVVLAVPVTFLPQLAGAALAVHAQRSPAGLMPFVWTWLLQVLPVLLAVSAAMLALGTITGRPILAILGFAAALPLALGALQDVLAYAHRKLDGPGRFLSFDERAIQELVWTVRGYWSLPVVSESGWPVEAAFDAMLPGAMMTFAAAVALLGVAPAFLRRTRRDIRPWRIREDHPLRTFLRAINRVREEYALDAGRQRADVLLFLAALALAAASFAALLARESRFKELAAQRYASEVREPAPMSESLVVRSIRVEGTLGREVRTRTTLAIENRGARPESHLAFRLHPALALQFNVGRGFSPPPRGERPLHGDRTGAPGGGLKPRPTLDIRRSWDHVTIELAQPIQPGQSRTLHFDISGTPDTIDFSLRGAGPFKNLYARYLRATTTVELSDLSRSRIVPAASRDRMLLAASDITLVPRYATPNDPPAIIETDLRTSLPAADSCGSTGRVLRKRCTLPLASYTVAAAHLRAMPLAPGTTLLHLGPHEALARTHAPALTEAMALAERAWPGVIEAKGVFVERPTKPGERIPWRDDETDIRSSGVLYLVPETMFIRHQPIPPGAIAASMVSSALLGRRPVLSSERWFFTSFYAEAARARLGGSSRDATVSRHPSTDPLLRLGNGAVPQARLRAVLAELEYRVGADRVAAGIGDFVKMPGEGNGRQLLDAIAKRANADLDRFYRDYFDGEALPQLSFENVTFTRAAGGWEVRGTLRNEGTGEVFCPVVLRTEHGAIKRVLRIDSAQAVPFVISAQHAPRVLQLDPDRVCYRVSRIGLTESVEYRGAS
ncbi:MAG TPA: hypothetical protein VF432_18385 [Thermoanaerobaculia bacterium]